VGRIVLKNLKGNNMLEYNEVKIKVYNKNIWDFCNSNKFLVSVVVVTCQRKENMEKCLYSITNQKTDFDFEIVIVDDASSDGTDQVVEKMCSKFIETKRLKYIKICNRLGYTKPSYIGAAASDGKYIIFQPSDMVAIHPGGKLHDRALSRLIEEMKDDTIASLAKGCIPLNHEAELDKDRGLVTHCDIDTMHAKAPSEAWFALGAIRWVDYMAKTIFRDPFVDSKLGVELLKDGRKVKWLDDVVAVHFPHLSSGVGGRSQHWWNDGKEPF